MRVGGELVAIAHTVKPTGYKAPNAYGSRTRFDGTTTNGVANKKVRTIGETSGGEKKLAPYHPPPEMIGELDSLARAESAAGPPPKQTPRPPSGYMR